MLKTLLAGTAALAIVGTSLVYAQQGPGRGEGFGGPGMREHGMSQGMHHGWRPSADDISAFSDARIAALKAGLKLTPEQEKNWPALESALRDMAKQRSERFAARASADRPADPIERLNLRAERMSQAGASLKKLADAAGPLYQSLDDAQKARFRVLAQLGQGRHFGGHEGRGHEGRHGMGDRMMHRGPRGGGERDDL